VHFGSKSICSRQTKKYSNPCCWFIVYMYFWHSVNSSPIPESAIESRFQPTVQSRVYIFFCTVQTWCELQLVDWYIHQKSVHINLKEVHRPHASWLAWMSTKKCQRSFCVVQTMSCRLKKVYRVTSPGQVRSTHCGFLGVSLLTRTHLAQVQKYTSGPLELLHEGHPLWLTGCLLLTNCKTHLALEIVYTVTSLGQSYI